jgi:hypothetical protein
LKALFPLLSPAFGSNNYPPVTSYEEENGSFCFYPITYARPHRTLYRDHDRVAGPHVLSSPTGCRPPPPELAGRTPPPPLDLVSRSPPLLPELAGWPPPPPPELAGWPPTPPPKLAGRPLLYCAPLPYGIGSGPQLRRWWPSIPAKAASSLLADTSPPLLRRDWSSVGARARSPVGWEAPPGRGSRRPGGAPHMRSAAPPLSFPNHRRARPSQIAAPSLLLPDHRRTMLEIWLEEEETICVHAVWDPLGSEGIFSKSHNS